MSPPALSMPHSMTYSAPQEVLYEMPLDSGQRPVGLAMTEGIVTLATGVGALLLMAKERVGLVSRFALQT